MYVLIHFNAEPFEVQQMFYGQWITRSVNYFKEKYAIDVGLFNVYKYKDEMRKLQRLEEAYKDAGGDDQLPSYYLVYWGEHVFPCLKSNLQNVFDYQDKLIGQFEASGERLFMIMPPLLHYLLYEMKAYGLKQCLLEEGKLHTEEEGNDPTLETHLFWRMREQVSLVDVIGCEQLKLTNKFHADTQRFAI